MKKNMGIVDKTLRVFAAAVIALLFFTKVISGTVAIILMVIAVMFIVTSFISFCPMYPLFGINTRKKE
ncbi:MAG: DUF2892 domain-containing protein [Bacteroidia bacterium]|nr:DUF2892 domain-containing protein [Bacteroidia bacterium]